MTELRGRARQRWPYTALAIGIMAFCACSSGGGNGDSEDFESTPDDESDQSVARSFDLCPTWQSGDQATLEFSREQSRDGIALPQPVDRTTEVVAIEVTTTGNVFEWREQTPDLEPFLAITGDNEVAQDFVDMMFRFVEIPLEIETDECGAYVGVRNWRVLQSNGISLMAEILTNRPGNDAPDEATAQAIAGSFLSTREATEAIFARWPQLYFSVYGLEIGEGEELEFDVVLPNPLGGEPLAARATFSVAPDAAEDDCVLVAQQAVFDPKNLGESFQSIAERIAADAGATGSAEDFPDLAIADRAEYRLCENTPWALSIVHERVAAAKGQVMLDTRRISAID